MSAKETTAKVAKRIIAHDEPARQNKPDETLRHVENHKMRLHDDKKESNERTTEVSELELVMVLFKMQDKANKAHTIHAKSDKTMVLQHVFKRRQTHKGETLVLKMTENGFGIKEEEDGDEKVPAGGAPPGNTILACNGEAETKNLIEHAKFHGEDGQKDGNVASADDGAENEGENQAGEKACDEVAGASPRGKLMGWDQRGFCGGG